MRLGLRHFIERRDDNSGHPILHEENGEELLHTQPGVAIVLGNQPPEYPGTLYISTKQVIWLSDTTREKGYAVDFLSLSLHAVSRDPENYPNPCIYTQIETEYGEDSEESEGSDAECNHILELSKVTEMRLVPSDPSQLDTLFDIFCECAELNPDPVEENEEENDWIFGYDQMTVDDGDTGEDPDGIVENLSNPIGHTNQEQDLARTVLELQIDDQRFQDAEESESETHNINGHLS